MSFWLYTTILNTGSAEKKSKYDFKILKDSNLAKALFYVNSFVRKEWD